MKLFAPLIPRLRKKTVLKTPGEIVPLEIRDGVVYADPKSDSTVHVMRKLFGFKPVIEDEEDEASSEKEALSEMTVAELREHAEGVGVDVPSRIKKDDLIGLLMASD